MIQFDRSYLKLPEQFYRQTIPTPAREPKLRIWNEGLAADLGIPSKSYHPNEIANIFSGNAFKESKEVASLAYAGHQFGHFVPQLGDGRAHLIGELTNTDGELMDIQLKGSGRTPFSRGGDGRCALGPALREYLMSEAIHSLKIPTTRSLCVVTTGEPVYRESSLPGAVLTRVASSHIRVGTFEYFAARNDHVSLKYLTTYALERHGSKQSNNSETEIYLTLIDEVMDRQISLVVEWLRVGFVHGVMNTDNFAISGDTIDFGPCAMMNAYNPNTVFSSIDRQGRYSFGNQRSMCFWNLCALAEALLGSIDPKLEEAAKLVRPILEKFDQVFDERFATMMAKKLGFSSSNKEVENLSAKLLELMTQEGLDYTNTFLALAENFRGHEFKKLHSSLGPWVTNWLQILERAGHSKDSVYKTMQSNNPQVIPRNHLVEAALDASYQGDDKPFLDLLETLKSPYKFVGDTAKYQSPPADGDAGYKTFCGT